MENIKKLNNKNAIASKQSNNGSNSSKKYSRKQEK